MNSLNKCRSLCHNICNLRVSTYSVLYINVSYLTSNFTKCNALFNVNTDKLHDTYVRGTFLYNKTIYKHSSLRRYKSSFRYETLPNLDNESMCNPTLGTLRNKILYNSVLESNYRSWLKRKILAERALKQQKYIELNSLQVDEIPIALKYLKEQKSSTDEETTITNKAVAEETVQMPYSTFTERLNEPSSTNKEQLVSSSKDFRSSRYCNEVFPLKQIADEQSDSNLLSDLEHNLSIKRNWMTDYEQYDDNEVEDIVSGENPWQMNYGTPDMSVAVSKIPCGGCGALLHCQDPAIPGYLPSELFLRRQETELRAMHCQRCHFLTHYDTALHVNVSPDDYPHMLAHIREKRALVILMVDLMDFPCSIWPGILDIIGTQRPVVVVGNKVDLLPQDCPGFLDHIRRCLATSLMDCGFSAANIRHIALVSASTGYGVEELITKLHNLWEYNGDVYLLGCTNVGKSTLFNALLQSDYCKVQAVDMVQRATTAQWPGTTLNLLKFPILRPSNWRLYRRVQRLQQEQEGKMTEQKMRQLQLKSTKKTEHATLIGHIGRTFREEGTCGEENDLFSVRMSALKQLPPTIGLDPKSKPFKASHWCYDTPGTVQPDQLLHLLTTEELMLAIPKTLLEPRTFRIKPDLTLLLAGLARLDYVQGETPLMLTVFASPKLPITVCPTADADELYQELAGSELLCVPFGGPVRMAQWPGLTAHSETLQVLGKGWKESSADIVLSSAGWVAVTPPRDYKCQFRAWTPHGRGVFLRDPALMRFSVNHRGVKIRDTPAYHRGKAVYIKN